MTLGLFFHRSDVVGKSFFLSFNYPCCLFAYKLSVISKADIRLIFTDGLTNTLIKIYFIFVLSYPSRL